MMVVWTRWMAPLVMTAVVPAGSALGQTPGETPAPAPSSAAPEALPVSPGPSPDGPVRPIHHNPPSPHIERLTRGPGALGGIAGLEVTRDDIPAKATRNMEQMTAVMRTLHAATWTPASGLPRSRPDLWIRLVPKSGEGGASVLVHGEVAYISQAPDALYRLDAATATALKAAVWPVRDAIEAPILPAAVTENLAGIWLRLANRAGNAPAVVITGDQLRLEPPAVDTDGKPMEIHFALDAKGMAAVTHALGICGVFARAPRFHSPAVTAPAASAPAESTEGPAPPIAPGGEGMTVTVRAGDWHRSWHEALGPAVFQHCLQTLERTSELAEAKAALLALRNNR